VHGGLDTWRGGDIVVGMSRQDFDLDLARDDTSGGRATCFTQPVFK
jgi:hypothetical protein